MTATSTRELAVRAIDGLEVSLRWCGRDGRLTVAVTDAKMADSFELLVGQDENPLDVFNHPFAYAAFHGVDYLTPGGEPGVAVYT